MKKQEIINFGIKLGISQNNILKVLELVTGLDKSQLFLSNNIDDKFIGKIEKHFARLVSGEPIEYILNKAEFFGFDFYVDSRVLVPRNDTEVMVDQVLKSSVPDLYIDIGTGSSCIILSTLLSLDVSVPNKNFVVDISEEVLEVAKINIKKHNLENKIKQINGDLLEYFISNLGKLKKEEYKKIIITANLPYIKNGDFKNMDEETINFEPDLALYGGEKTGFELYEKLIYQIFELKNIYNIKEIILFIEIGFDQKEIAIEFLEKQNLKFKIFKDNGGIDRCIKIYF